MSQGNTCTREGKPNLLYEYEKCHLNTFAMLLIEDDTILVMTKKIRWVKNNRISVPLKCQQRLRRDVSESLQFVRLVTFVLNVNNNKVCAWCRSTVSSVHN